MPSAMTAAELAVPTTAERDDVPAWCRLRVVVPAVVALFLLRLVLIGAVDLGDDEAYYWSWSRHLDWSYFDHPGMVAWGIRLSTALLGATPFAIRLPTLLWSAGASVLLFVLARRILPAKPAVAYGALLAANLAPMLSIGAVFTAPDAPFALFWLAALVCAWEARREPRWWYACGVATGLGLVSKYNMVLIGPVLLAWLWTGGRRAQLKTKEPWIALAIASLFFAPVVIWNAEHHWASFAFHLVGRHHGRFLPFTHLGQFAAAQVGLLSPVLLVAVLAGIALAWRMRATSDAHAFLFWASAFVPVFFAVLCPFGDFKPHWPAAGWLVGIVPAVEWLLPRRRLGLAAIAVAACFTALLYVAPLAPLGAWIPSLPPKADLTNEMHGWAEADARIAEIKAAMPDPARTFVFAHMYQNAAQAELHAPADWTVTRLGSRHDEYEIVRDDAALAGRDAIFVSRDGYDLDPIGRFAFRSCEPAGELPYERGGRVVRTFRFWRCFGYSP